MNIVDFLNKNDIAWFPIELEFITDENGNIKKEIVNCKDSKLHSSHFYHGNKRPHQNDFKELPLSIIKNRQSLLHLANAIAIDTRTIFQIDIDTRDYDDSFDTIKFNTPYFDSLTKKLPHMFIKSNFQSNSVRLQFDNNGVGGVELLCGQWAWCDKNIIVNNADYNIYEFSSKKLTTLLKNYTSISPSPSPSIDTTNIATTNTNTAATNNMWKDLLFNVIINDSSISYDDWLVIGSVMKFNGFTRSDFLKFTNDETKIDDTLSHWDRFKNKNVPIDILIKYAKSTNINGFSDWKIKWNYQEITFCNDDDEAGLYLLQQLKHIFKSYKSRLFYKHNNIWICDSVQIDDILLEVILTSKIYKRDSKGHKITYAQNVNSATSIRRSLISKVRIHNEDPNLYQKFHTTTKSCICFQDGVLNFKTKSFTLWSDLNNDDIYTTFVIPRNFKHYFDNPNQIIIDDIKTKILKPLFGNKINTALHFFSRAIAGHVEDKRWMTYVGNRNCGKGVFYELMATAFYDYVKPLNLDNLLCTRVTDGADIIDSSKKLYWLMDHEFTRIAISQETPPLNSSKKLNAALLKKIIGGGDKLVARRNYDRFDTHFYTQMSTAMFGNSELYSTADDVFETCVPFASIVQFKSQEEIDLMISNKIGLDDLIEANTPQNVINDLIEKCKNSPEMIRYHVADSDIKNKCCTIDYANAMVMLLLQSFKLTAVPVVYETQKDDSNLNTIIDIIQDLFEITQNKTGKDADILLYTDVICHFKEFDKCKVDLEFSALGVIKKQCNFVGNYRNKQCLWGIKMKSLE